MGKWQSLYCASFLLLVVIVESVFFVQISYAADSSSINASVNILSEGTNSSSTPRTPFSLKFNPSTSHSSSSEPTLSPPENSPSITSPVLAPGATPGVDSPFTPNKTKESSPTKPTSSTQSPADTDNEAIPAAPSSAILLHGAINHDRHHLSVERIDFYYKLDEKTRFLTMKNQWQSQNRGDAPLRKAVDWATQAQAQSSVPVILTQWRYQGGPSPDVITAQAHLVNGTSKAILTMSGLVTLKAQVGALRTDPILQMTDLPYLERSSHWELLYQDTVHIAAMAPDEDLLLPLITFNLLYFLNHHPGQWPLRLEVTLSGKALGTHHKMLYLRPDHFDVPSTLPGTNH